MGPYREPEACEAIPIWLRPSEGKLTLLEQGVEHVAGRAGVCDIVVQHVSVSRRHVLLVAGIGHVVVRDLGSTGGTFVNGARVQGTCVARVGDWIRLAGAEPYRVDQGHDLEGLRIAARREPKKCMIRRPQSTLDEVPLCELIELFATARKTGVLALRGRAGEATIRFRMGVMDGVSMGAVTVTDPAAVAAAIDEIGAWGDAVFDLLPPAPPDK